MLKVLGKGGYAKVLLVKHIETGLLYAMKILKKKFIGKLLKTIEKKK
jgi:serine/threonine protein kinase